MRQPDESERQWRLLFAKSSDQDDDGLHCRRLDGGTLSDADRERCAFSKRLDWLEQSLPSAHDP